MTQTIHTLAQALAAWNREVDRQTAILAEHRQHNPKYEKNIPEYEKNIPAR